MREFTPEEQKKIERLSKVMKGGVIAILQYIDELENKIQDVTDLIKRIEADNFNSKLNEPSIIDIVNNLKNDPVFLELIKPEIQTVESTYALTNADKDAIAAIASSLITPPNPVVIEKTTVEVQQPIVTNNTTREVIEKAMPDTPEETRDKLELLPKGERLSVEFIDGIRELFAEFERRYNGRGNSIMAGNLTGGHIVKSYDISSQLNGVLKTFNLPALWRVISVHSSSIPNTFRETVDYTWTGQSITFTSEINAASTLATGQTITIVYSE